MRTVEWFPALNTVDKSIHPLMMDPLFLEPQPYFDFIKQNSTNLALIKCPSFQEYVKNIFVIRSPLDFSLVINKDRVKAYNNRQNYREPYELFDINCMVDYKSPDSGQLLGENVVDIGFQYYFVTENKDTTMQNIDVPLYFNKWTNVPGEFDISKWVRPTNFTFFTNEAELDFKRGQPIYAVKFIAKNNKKINLDRITDQSRIDLITLKQAQSTNIKHFLPNLSLNHLYDIFSERMKDIFKK